MIFLNFMFQSFWHFLGCAWLIGVACNLVVKLFKEITK